MRFSSGLMAVLIASHTAPGLAATFTNPGFETGDFSGWTLFTNPGGLLGSEAFPGTLGDPVFPRPPKPATPAVLSFDVDGDGSASFAAAFDAGKEALGAGPGGGGLFQAFTTGAGTLALALDIATWVPLFTNGDAGSVRLLVNGTELDAHHFGEVNTGFPGATGGAIVRNTLAGTIALSAGVHELRIAVERPYTNSTDTPLQYVDDLSAQFSPVPLPAAGWLIGAALLGLAPRLRRHAGATGESGNQT